MIPHQLGGYYREDDPGEPSSGVARVSVTDDERDVLAAMADGKWVFEIGTGLGVSTRALASTATHVVTCDIDEWVHRTIWPDLPANVTPVPAVLADQLGRRFDMVFIDGDHSDEALRIDVATAERLLKPGGSIVVHDAHHLMPVLGPGWGLMDTGYGLAIKQVVE